jgi:hypothetical protein
MHRYNPLIDTIGTYYTAIYGDSITKLVDLLNLFL